MLSGAPCRTRRRAAVGLLVVVLGASGCGAGDPVADPSAQPAAPEVVELTVGGQPAVAVVPDVEELSGLVLYVHGAGEDADSLQGGDDQARVTARLVSDGYVVAASDAHLDAFGNTASQQDYVDLAAELSDRYGTTRTFLLAESMGGVAGLQLLAGDRIPGLLGMAAISPLVDLDVIVGTDYETPVREAWGGRLPTGTENPAELPAEAFAGTSLRFYLAAEDELVVSAQNADPLVARLQGVADVSVVACEGGHIDPSCFQPDDLADWFGGLAG